MFDSPTQASSSSSTLVTTTTTDSTSTPSPIHTNAKTFASSQKSRPKLSLNTSFSSTTRLGGSKNPKMSDKGFIEPHASHLPRRIRPSNKRERTKTAPVPSLLRGQEQEQEQLEHQLEQLREQLQLDQQLEPASDTQPNKVDVDPIPTTKPPQPAVSTHPHRDNLPRRTRVHTVPINNTQTRRGLPLPLPISIVDSQSTIGAGTHGHLASFTSSIDPPQDPEEAEPSVTPNPPPFKFNSKALSLISKAQNKAFNSRPSHINDNNDRRLPSSPAPTSPQLPHPAMGLTMGIMDAYARDDDDDDGAEVGDATRPPHTLLRFGLSYSPALGVRGTPPTLPPSANHPRFGPAPPPTTTTRILANTSTLIPTISITAPTPPMSAPLGQNLPRRHRRYRRRAPHAEAEAADAGLGGGSVAEREVLRFERVRVSAKEGNEEEDGLFSSLLDFERAGSAGVGGAMSSPGQVGDTGENGWPTHYACSPRTRGGGGEDPRCIQVLGRSRVEVGYMRESEVKERGDCVLVELVESDNAAVCREGVPSLLPEQIRAGCEFMKGWIGSGEGQRRTRISVPRWRAQDAFGLAVCFLVWAEAQRQCLRKDGQEQEWIVPKVNDLESVSRAKGEEVYTPIHLLYMRLLDDGDGEDVEEEQDWWRGLSVGGKGKGGMVGLGILGVRLGPDEAEAEADADQSAHSDSTVGSSCPTSVRPLGRKQKGRGGGYHVREAAIGGPEAEFQRPSSSLSSSPSLPSQKSSPFGDRRNEWTGLRGEWRGVLSYEGLNTLVGVWP